MVFNCCIQIRSTLQFIINMLYSNYVFLDAFLSCFFSEIRRLSGEGCSEKRVKVFSEYGTQHNVWKLQFANTVCVAH